MSADLRSDATHSTSDRYDFERLERAIEHLLEEHGRLQAEREALPSGDAANNDEPLQEAAGD